jgi:hypothetical protein
MFLRATSFDHAAAEKIRNKAPRITMLRTITATVVGAARTLPAQSGRCHTMWPFRCTSQHWELALAKSAA